MISLQGYTSDRAHQPHWGRRRQGRLRTQRRLPFQRRAIARIPSSVQWRTLERAEAEIARLGVERLRPEG